MRVFTVNQILNKQIPYPGQFLEIKMMLTQGFKSIYEAQHKTDQLRMLGAVLIGSMARGHDMACTSDVDIVVFYDDHLADDALIAEFARVHRGQYTDALLKACMYNVPTQIYNVFSSKLVSGETRHTKQFLKHAIVSMDGFDGKSPSGLLAGDLKAVRKMFQKTSSLTYEQARQYVVGKQEKLRDSHFSWGGLVENAEAKMCADLFNAPFHGARQVLDVLGMHYIDTKEGVINQITKLSIQTAERLTLIAGEAKSYGEQCVLFRDDKQNKVKHPCLAVEAIYKESYACLTELRGFIETL